MSMRVSCVRPARGPRAALERKKVSSLEVGPPSVQCWWSPVGLSLPLFWSLCTSSPAGLLRRWSSPARLAAHGRTTPCTRTQVVVGATDWHLPLGAWRRMIAFGAAVAICYLMYALLFVCVPEGFQYGPNLSPLRGALSTTVRTGFL